MKYKFLLLSILFIPSFAKTEKIVSKMTALTIELPRDWNHVTDLYGIPHAIIAPSFEEKKRTIIAITPTGRKFSELSKIDFSKDQKNYEKGRAQWVKKYEGKIIKFLKYKENPLIKIKESHQYGYQYAFQDTNKEEITIFANCNKELVHFKIMSDLNDKESRDQAVNILNSIECGDK